MNSINKTMKEIRRDILKQRKQKTKVTSLQELINQKQQE